MKAPGRRATALLISILVVNCPARANEQPTEDYRSAMKTLEAASAILRHHARMVEPGGDFGYAWVENDAATLKAAFEVTLKFWETKNVKSAIRLAQNAVSDAQVLERAARARHYDGVVAGVGGVLAACEPCHTTYREQLPDGSFTIR